MTAIELTHIQAVIDNNDRTFIEELAQKARQTTIQYFGRAISLYAPIYLANYCDNHCIYCGFKHSIEMDRKKLSADDIRSEMKKVAETGIQNILLLTGESRKMTPVSYIKDAVIIAKEFFPAISLEVYPLEIDEYKELYEAGVDGITIYQETYDRARYKELHPKGRKRDYDYRYDTPERIAKAGIRTISMGVLLGLSEPVEDIYRLFSHLQWLEKHYPGVEYSVSFPRLIPLEDSPVDYVHVSDITLIKLICLARIMFPRVGINLSTREGESIRDHALQIGVTRISAASKTNVGGYSSCETKDPQFEVIDNRSVQEITDMLRGHGFDPVFTDWRRIDNR
jgi:2-iminoacetate synthase